MAIDPAGEIYRRLQENGIKEIERMRDEQEQESLFLDFKAARGNKAPMEEEDRKTLGEALSGFANTEGGVLVWGVDCRRGTAPDDADAVQGLKPIQGLQRWLSDLQTFEHQVVSPALAGVRHHIILEPVHGEDCGYAITYVPKSESVPHMAIAKTKDQYSYFLRSGTSFVKMGHSMVADRFGRRPHPDLHVSLYGRSQSEKDNTRTYELVLGIKNVGRGLAVYPALLIRLQGSLQFLQFGLDGNGNDGLPRHNRGFRQDQTNERMYAGGINDVIHPGTTRDVTKLTFSFPIDALLTKNHIALAFGFELFAEGYSRKDIAELPLNTTFTDTEVSIEA